MALNSGYSKRAYRHWFEDGIGEMGVGVLLTLFTGLLWLTRDSSIGEVAAVLLAFALFLLGGAALRFGAKRLKARISYPRTGFVQMRRKQREVNLGRVGFMLVLIVVLGIIGWSMAVGLLVVFAVVGRIDASLILFGLVLSLPIFVTGWKIDLYRLYVVGGAVVVASVVLFFTDVPGAEAIILLYGVAGVALLISGAGALIYFLRTYPPVDGETA